LLPDDWREHDHAEPIDHADHSDQAEPIDQEGGHDAS
jgi:hypothetical protein